MRGDLGLPQISDETPVGAERKPSDRAWGVAVDPVAPDPDPLYLQFDHHRLGPRCAGKVQARTSARPVTGASLITLNQRFEHPEFRGMRRFLL